MIPSTSTCAINALVPLWLLLAQVRVSRPGDVEFNAMSGGLGACGVITELVLQMTPPSLTTINTIDNTDADLFADMRRILAVRACVDACGCVAAMGCY